MKITDKQLLELFAHWDGDITWPSGAHLVQGWDEEWDGDVLVVDKSGKNVLFDVNVDPDHFFIIDIFDADGASGYTESDSAPGSYTQTSFNSGHFELFDDISEANSQRIFLAMAPTRTSFPRVGMPAM